MTSFPAMRQAGALMPFKSASLAPTIGSVAASAGERDVLAVIILRQLVDRLLAACDTPQQKPAHALGMADRVEDREPRAGRGAADIHGQGAELLPKVVEVVRPYFVLGGRAVEGNVGCAAIAPVVQQHAVAARGDRPGEAGQFAIAARGY